MAFTRSSQPSSVIVNKLDRLCGVEVVLNFKTFHHFIRDVKSSRPGRPRGQIFRPRPRSRPHSCWPRPHKVWPRSRASWPHDLDNSQVDGNYELSTSFSVLSLNP